MSWQFGSPGQVLFGRGSVEELSAACQVHQIRRPILVTDRHLVALGIASRVERLLQYSCDAVCVYDGCVAEPPIRCAVDATSAAQAFDADAVVALGGGSNMDVGKMVATLLAHAGTPQDYFGYDRIPGPIVPLIAIPTTSGTGSEVSHSSVLTDEQAGIKVSTLSRYLRPKMAIVDSSLTDSCPPTVTAHSGIDALVHAIEAYTARDSEAMPESSPLRRAYDGSNRLTKVIAAEAIRLIGKSLVTAVKDGTRSAAREDMALAAMLAGMAFSNSGVAIVHALEYPIGALTHCSHGEGNGLLLPHVMRFNAVVRAKEFAEIGRLLTGGEPVRENPEGSADDAIEQVVRLQNAVGIRLRLRELGLQESSLPLVAAKAFQIKRLMDTNPRIPTESDLLSILQAAY